MIKQSAKNLLTSAVLGILMLCAATAHAGVVLLGSTTSTQNSGLLDYLLAAYSKVAPETQIRVIAKGTGQVLEIARRGDLDMLLVHDRAGEDEFVAQGYARERFDVMYNDFVIVGPREQELDASDMKSVLQDLSTRKYKFISRGDDSGTHRAELRAWQSAGLEPKGNWYIEAGLGMGATLNMAVQMQAFTLTDRGTWIALPDKGDLVIKFENSPPLMNVYGVLVVDPTRHKHSNSSEAQAFANWLLSEQGQAQIARFTVQGQQLFFPIAQLARE